MQLKIVCYKTDCFLHILQKAFFKQALDLTKEQRISHREESHGFFYK